MKKVLAATILLLLVMNCGDDADGSKNAENKGQNRVAQPVVSLPAGNYDSTVNVYLISATEDAKIYYSLDGSLPDKTSSEYQDKISIEQTTTLRAIAYKQGLQKSNPITVTYGIAPPKLAPPDFSVEGGIHSTEVNLVLTSPVPGAVILYSDDENDVDINSNIYDGPIQIESDTTIQAFAIKTGYEDSDVRTATYAMSIQLEPPTFTVAGGVFADTDPQTVNVEHAKNGVTIYYTVDGTIPHKGSTVYSGPLLINSDTNLRAYAVLDGFVDSDEQYADYYFKTNCTLGNWCRVYVTDQVSSDNDPGIAGADATCQADANKPTLANYKAFLVDGTNRLACTTVNCSGGSGEGIDWVLQSGVEYRQADGATVIGTTNNNALFNFPVAMSFTNNDSYMTGLESNWTTSSETCNLWQSNSPSEFGIFGDSTGGNLTDTLIDNGSVQCNFRSFIKTLCIEQP